MISTGLTWDGSSGVERIICHLMCSGGLDSEITLGLFVAATISIVQSEFAVLWTARGTCGPWLECSVPVSGQRAL